MCNVCVCVYCVSCDLAYNVFIFRFGCILASIIFKYVQRNCQGTCQNSPYVVMYQQTNHHRISPAQRQRRLPPAPARPSFVVDICKWLDI